MFRANIAENAGDIDGMRADIDAALAEFRRLGERWGLGNTLRGRALIHTLDGELEQAEAAYAEAFELMAQLKSHEDEAFLLVRLADIALRRGDPQRARVLIGGRGRDGGADRVGDRVGLHDEHGRRDRAAGRRPRDRAVAAAAGDEARRRRCRPVTPAMQHGRTIVLVLSARLAFGDGEREQAFDLAGEAYQAALAHPRSADHGRASGSCSQTWPRRAARRRRLRGCSGPPPGCAVRTI